MSASNHKDLNRFIRSSLFDGFTSTTLTVNDVLEGLFENEAVVARQRDSNRFESIWLTTSTVVSLAPDACVSFCNVGKYFASILLSFCDGHTDEYSQYEII